MIGVSNRDEHEPTDGGDKQGAQRSRRARGLGASVVALLIAIAALLVLALATQTETPDVRDPTGPPLWLGAARGRRACPRSSRRTGVSATR